MLYIIAISYNNNNNNDNNNNNNNNKILIAFVERHARSYKASA